MEIRYSEANRWVDVLDERGRVARFEALAWRREVLPAARAIHRVHGWPLVNVDDAS